MKYNKLHFILLILISWGSSSQSKLSDNINTEFNEELIASRKTFEGQLEYDDYIQIRETILKELNTTVPENNSILINYYQYGTNCIEYGLSEKDAMNVIENKIRISSKLSKESNASDFFIYSAKALNKERIENRSNFILDSGFFDKIFDLKETCTAFFILKPNGKFMKYYGSDYFTLVRNYLEKE